MVHLFICTFVQNNSMSDPQILMV